MKWKEYTEKNRIAWNAVMPYHQKAMKAEWDNNFELDGFIIQEEPELGVLRNIGIAGKDVVHLCCNNGRELLSLKNMGAGRCLGFDISDSAISAAKERATKTGLDVEYLRSDVYEIGEEHFDSFDLVYITIGALVWLPDIQKFFNIANNLLREGGKVFIYDTHPFAEVLPWDVSEDTKPYIENPYFCTEALEFTETMDYYGGAEYDAPPHYEFSYTMSEIMMALINNGFQIDFFEEYERDISNCYCWMQKKNLKFPLSYILTANKQKDLLHENRRIETGGSKDS